MNENILSDENFDIMLKKAAEEYCQEYLQALPSEEEFKQKYPARAEFDKKMYKICAQQERRRLALTTTTFIKTASVITFTCAISLYAFFFSLTAQASVREMVMKWFSEFSVYGFSGSSANIKDAEWEFAYIPNGYELSDSYIIAEAKYSIYTNEAEEIIFTNIDKLSNEPKIYMDNEDSVYSQIELNGVTADLYVANSDNKNSHLIWTQDGYTFYISGNLHKDDLVKMAKSTKLKV